MERWRYYNHAVIPTSAPHEIVDTTDIKNGSVWKQYPHALLARWITDWDCGYETNWWYEICDKAFDISAIKSDKRYKINKGLKNFCVQIINPSEYVEALFDVHTKANRSYPEKNRILFSYEEYCKTVKKWERNPKIKIYAAFYKETNELCGFIVGTFYESYFELTSQKADPEYEKYQINAAMVYTFLVDNATLIDKGIYCNDGARSINHETNFQDYLERYFGFRKAYCRLHVEYRSYVKTLVNCVYIFRHFFYRLDRFKTLHAFVAILKQEELLRSEKTIGDYYG